MPVVSGGSGGSSFAQLDYVEQSNSLTVTATVEGSAQSFIDGNAVTFDGVTRVKVEFWCGAMGIISGTGVVILVDGSTSLGWLAQIGSGTATTNTEPVYCVRYLTPSAGAHTFHIKMWKTAGTFIASSGVGGSGVQIPAWYRISTP